MMNYKPLTAEEEARVFGDGPTEEEIEARFNVLASNQPEMLTEAAANDDDAASQLIRMMTKIDDAMLANFPGGVPQTLNGLTEPQKVAITEALQAQRFLTVAVYERLRNPIVEDLMEGVEA